MKKLFSLLALTLVCAITFAASITAPNVDFGTISIKGKQKPVTGSQTVVVTWSGLTSEGTSMWAEISEGAVDDETNPNGFYVSDPDYVYLGYGDKMISSCSFNVSYMVKEAGTFTGKLHLYSYDTSWEQVDAYADITITVTDEAIVGTLTPFERVNTTSELQDGDIVVFVNESAGAVSGKYTGDYAYIPALTEDVSINKTTGKAEVPDAAQMFKATKYSGNWQFTTTDTEKRLHMNVSGSGAFTYAATQAGTILANWGVEVNGGVAVVSRPDEDQSFPVRFNGDRFKPYKSAVGTDIALYKKVGEAQAFESSLTVDPISFGGVEYDEEKTVEVTYTAAHLTDDILWAIEGTDAALFDLQEEGNRESGKLTITYKGTAGKTGAVDAKLSYLTQDIQLDAMDGSFPISMTLLPASIKLTALAFSDAAPATIDQGQSIDMSQYVLYTPSNAEVKDLNWTVDHTYQGEVDENGVLTAKHVTGQVVVTATSVRVPSVSASHTLTIKKPVVTDFTLSKSEVTLNIGGTETLTITAYVPSYASETASFSSDKTSVATVSNKGVITAKGLGEANITAKIGDVEKVCKVTVVAVAVESIAFAETDANVVLGTSLQLEPIVSPAQAATEYTISYESNDEAIVTVDENGKVTPVALGDAVITATISDKQAQITIHVVSAPMFTKVTDASQLGAKDTIILAMIYTKGDGDPYAVIAGKRDNKKLTVLTEDVTVTDTEAYAKDACRMVLGTDKNQAGFTLTIVGASKPIAVASGGNDIVDANTQNCRYWNFEADGTKGITIHNIGNSNAMFKYHAGNAAVKPYKINTSGAEFIYVYVRKYVAPVPTGVDNTEINADVRKVIRDGQLLIIRNGEIYTVTGEKL